MRFVLTLVIVLCAGVVRADALADLRTSLGALSGGAAALKGRLEYQLWREVSEDKKSSQAKAQLRFESGPEGLRLFFGAGLFKAVGDESRRQLQNPDEQVPLRTTLRAVEPDEVAEMLDFAPALLRYVDYMQLVGDQQDSFQGAPARMLVVKIAPRLPSNIQKYLKSVDVDGRIWLGADGVPLGFRNNIAFRGSRMLISFDGMFKDERSFQRVGQRLLVLRHAHEESFATLGQRNQSRRLTILTVAE